MYKSITSTKYELRQEPCLDVERTPKKFFKPLKLFMPSSILSKYWVVYRNTHTHHQLVFLSIHRVQILSNQIATYVHSLGLSTHNGLTDIHHMPFQLLQVCTDTGR